MQAMDEHPPQTKQPRLETVSEGFQHLAVSTPFLCHFYFIKSVVLVAVVSDPYLDNFTCDIMETSTAWFITCTCYYQLMVAQMRQTQPPFLDSGHLVHDNSIPVDVCILVQYSREHS